MYLDFVPFFASAEGVISGPAGDGRVALEPAAGFPGSLRVSAERAELVSSPLMTAVASLNLALTGPLARTPKIAGRIDLVSVDVSVPASVMPRRPGCSTKWSTSARSTATTDSACSTDAGRW